MVKMFIGLKKRKNKKKTVLHYRELLGKIFFSSFFAKKINVFLLYLPNYSSVSDVIHKKQVHLNSRPRKHFFREIYIIIYIFEVYFVKSEKFHMEQDECSYLNFSFRKNRRCFWLFAYENRYLCLFLESLNLFFGCQTAAYSRSVGLSQIKTCG
jgi:hypothetical protein